MEITLDNLPKERNVSFSDEQILDYKNGVIKVYQINWEEYDEIKDKWRLKKKIICNLHRSYKLYKDLNLCECNDGTPFTAIPQAINVAKGLIDYDIERNIEINLLKNGYDPEDFFQYNSLKSHERIEIKSNLPFKLSSNLNKCFKIWVENNFNDDFEIINWFEKENVNFKVISIEDTKFRKNNTVGILFINKIYV